jgi:tetratricopeptide (TPR) repeat protein
VEAIGCGWNAMGLENAKCQRWDSAILCWEHALEIRLQIFGKYHPDVANTLNNLGIVWGKMQQYDRARESLNQALEIRTRIHACRGSANSIKNNNPHHTDIAATLYNIGNISHKMKDYDVALDSFNRAMKTHVILNDDLSAARTCAALGRLHLEKGDIDKALEAYLDALAFYSKAKYRKGDDEYDALIGDIDQAQQLLNKSRA